MLQKQQPQYFVTYYFVQSKNVYEEGDSTFLSLFSQLFIETTWIQPNQRSTKRETVWGEVDEVKVDHASQKLVDLVNGIQTYQVSVQVFQELLKITEDCPRELNFVVPFYICKVSQQPKYLSISR